MLGNKPCLGTCTGLGMTLYFTYSDVSIPCKNALSFLGFGMAIVSAIWWGYVHWHESRKKPYVQPMPAVVYAEKSNLFDLTIFDSEKIKCRKCGEVFLTARSLLNSSEWASSDSKMSVNCPKCGEVQPCQSDSQDRD